MGKELLLKGLVDEFGERNKLGEEEFTQILEKWYALSIPSVNNMIKDARLLCKQGGYIDNILKLKKASTYDYIHDSRFSSCLVDFIKSSHLQSRVLQGYDHLCL